MKKTISLLLVLCLLASFSAAFAVSVSDFNDVSSSDWFYSDVSYVVSKGMFNGISTTQFAPEATMTRGMFVTVLGRYGKVSAPPVTDDSSGRITKTEVRMRDKPSTAEGSSVLAILDKDTIVEIIGKTTGTDNASYQWYNIRHNGRTGYVREDLMTTIASSGSLSDVAADAYYAPYVYWAVNEGIAEKTGESTFSPDAAITREDICYMLYNYANSRNLKLTATLNPAPFTDSASISSSRSTAVTALQRCGIINGYPDGRFLPKNSANRAEVSAFVVRFINTISYKPDNSPSVDAGGNYIWGTEVPAGTAVNASYFSDACFIGHSIVVGMDTYFGFNNADFYATNGGTAAGSLTYAGYELSTTHTDEEGKEVPDTGTLIDAMSEHTYNKVYIMYGANEIGTSSYHQTTFYNNMSALIDKVRENQPTAVVYLFSFTPVSQDCSESREDLSRDNIIAYNSVTKDLCADKRCYYLNVFDLLVNDDGFLPDDAGMSDGIHILSSQYSKIKNYIMNHAV